MASVIVREGESLDNALNRFRRKIRKENLMDEIRRRASYQKPSVRRHQKKSWARHRAEKKREEQTRSPDESVLRWGP